METASNINKQLGIDFLDEKSTLANLQALDGTQMEEAEQPHRLHIYAHKHNTHITFVQPSKPASQTPHLASALTAKQTAQQQNKSIDVLLSLSTGNIGFKKAGRGSYDAAFQLAAFALRQIQEKGMAREVKHLEVVLRGFGAGREAVTKALLGTEGRLLRSKISSVADATRLKQGGGRSKKPRRLG
jgi:small subunit ribosomal protein S11